MNMAEQLSVELTMQACVKTMNDQAATIQSLQAQVEELRNSMKKLKALPKEYANFIESTSRHGWGVRWMDVQELCDAALSACPTGVESD